MNYVTDFISYLGPMQWFAAIVLVPLVVWQTCQQQGIVCRSCAVLSGYGVQIGFFLLLDDVGFSQALLTLLSSVAAYFWITTVVAAWPESKKAHVSVSAPLSNEASS